MTDSAINYRPQPGDLKFGRSKITNSPDLLLGKDARSVTARRFRNLVQDLIADAGGIERCSTAKIGLLRRLAAASVLAEMIEARAITGEAVDIGEFCNLASTTVRLTSRIGLNRRPKNITPSLVEYLDVAVDDEPASQDDDVGKTARASMDHEP